jgi:hypothetical protein
MTALLARSSGPADSLTAVPLNVALYGLRSPRSASPVQGQSLTGRRAVPPTLRGRNTHVCQIPADLGSP